MLTKEFKAKIIQSAIPMSSMIYISICPPKLLLPHLNVTCPSIKCLHSMKCVSFRVQVPAKKKKNVHAFITQKLQEPLFMYFPSFK